MLSLAVIRQNQRVPRRSLRPNRAKCYDLPDDEFISNFRLAKPLVHRLVEELQPMLEPKTYRRNVLSVETKVFSALLFFASGSYQRPVGNSYLVSMPQRSVSRCINDVAEAINILMLQRKITFPRDSRSQQDMKTEFHDYCGITGVIGAVDCTHVAIIAPSDDGFHNERSYLNRKGYHSLNVQLVCNMNQKILNIVARFPGACHDSFIWRASKLRESFADTNLIHGNGWLLGDSGYPNETWLHIPISGAVDGSAEADYNKSHAKGRSVIERCNGTLKSRFRCLLKHRVLHYQPETAGKIINACAVLHNMCVDFNMEWDDYADLEEDDLPWDTFPEHEI